MIEKHRRKSIRLEEYDYTQPGDYFITICTKNHECIFGTILNSKMNLNEEGKIVDSCWNGIHEHFSNVELDEYVLMPNHLHGIIAICECDGSRGEVTSPLHMSTLGQIIAYFKYQSTKLINELHNTPGRKCWQRNYYDRIIRNEKELNTIRDYITYNIVAWAPDKENPEEVAIFLKS